MWVRFDIYTSTNCGDTPTATTYAQVANTGGGVGKAKTTYSSSTEGTYCVIATVVAGSTGGQNAWYAADPSEAGVITFYLNTGQFVSGGGWVPDAGKRGNFGFNARFNKSGTPQGQLVYVYRGTFTGTCPVVNGKTTTYVACSDVPVNYVIKSNSITALGFTPLGTTSTGASTWPYKARMQGKATIQINRVSDGAKLWSEGNATFDSTVKDSGQSSGLGSDEFSLTVTRSTGGQYKDVAPSLLKGGNVVIHL